jgi:hypothetical protein
LKLTTDLHTAEVTISGAVPPLLIYFTISGAIPPLPIYVTISGAVLPLPIYLFYNPVTNYLRKFCKLIAFLCSIVRLRYTANKRTRTGVCVLVVSCVNAHFASWPQ